MSPTLSSASLDGTDLRRDIPVPESHRTEGYEAAFDATTLWYDAIAGPDRTWLVCPKLLNFEDLLRGVMMRIDGQAAPVLRIRSYRRHDVVELEGTGSELALEAGDHGFTCPISPLETDRFAGLNAHVAISKDNDLVWLADFARFHIQHHGLEAMLLFDNGSTATSIEEIETTLRATGLREVLVVPAPFPYGPRGTPPYARRTKFLQTALLNIARLRFLGQARAVLQCDIDELVWSEGGSIFDRAAESRLGLVRFKGLWHSPPQDSEGPYRHQDHIRQRAKDPGSPTKYALRPDSLLGRQSWDIHDIEGLPTPLSVTPRAGYLHCRGISTDWKGNNRTRPSVSVPSPKAERLLAGTDWEAP
ncbi:hypothetical protein AAD018_017050 [Aestuariibius insulae]|uniref:hypothetical protein n=1 Tax=Aestuariibius insulae TaxID=2058287 RepID=UPI00345E11AE